MTDKKLTPDDLLVQAIAWMSCYLQTNEDVVSAAELISQGLVEVCPDFDGLMIVPTDKGCETAKSLGLVTCINGCWTPMEKEMSFGNDD
jgi:hypothetical protein